MISSEGALEDEPLLPIPRDQQLPFKRSKRRLQMPANDPKLNQTKREGEDAASLPPNRGRRTNGIDMRKNEEGGQNERETKRARVFAGHQQTEARLRRCP